MLRHILLDQKKQKKIAVIEDNKSISYQEILQKSVAIQKELLQTQKLNIAIYLPNGSDYISAFFATLMLGMTAFPLNIFLTKYEIIPLLKRGSSNVIITSKVFDSMFKDIISHHITNLQIIYVEELHTEKCEELPAVISMNPNKTMVLLNTSGSTGKPKIVQLAEGNVEASALGYIDKMNFDKTNIDNIRYILATPFSSAYGLMILSVCFIKSFPIILLKEGFTLDTFYKMTQVHKATHYEGGSTVLQIMEQTITKPVPYNISSLKYFGFGGSTLSGSTLKTLCKNHPEIKFWQGYGMTESSPLITKYTNDKPKKLESVGTAIKGVKISVVAEGIITNTPYIRGEIIVKGKNVMLGYYKNEEATHKVLKNGYLYTGDIGYLDEEGYLYICGRKKNIIIIRGLNVYPEEVESCILNSLLVKDCIVYKDTDHLGNEIIHADIIPINSKVQVENIKAYCKLHLSRYKQPQKIQFVNTIQKVASGKTKRTGKEN